MIYRASYSRDEWFRADAWYNLLHQQIPGCPDLDYHRWRKSHTATEWAWIYAGGVPLVGRRFWDCESYEGKYNMKVKCTSCDASGVYRGFAEPAGVAVVCVRCAGSGHRDEAFGEAFITRRVRTDVKYVQRSRGTIMFVGVGPAGNAITYEQFLSGMLP